MTASTGTAAAGTKAARSNLLLTFWTKPTNNRPMKRWRIGMGFLSALFHASWLASWPLITSGGTFEQTKLGHVVSIPLIDRHYQPMLVATLGLAFSLLLASGFFLRIAAPLVAACTLSLLAYQPHGQTTGDYLVGAWTVLTAIYALGWPTNGWTWRAPEADISPWLRRMVLCQLCLLHFASAIHKGIWTDWKEGTAMGYALQFGRELRFAGSSTLLEASGLNQTITWGVLALEVVVAACLCTRSLQRVGTYLAIALHVGLALCFNLGLLTPAILIGLVVVSDSPRWWRREARPYEALEP